MRRPVTALAAAVAALATFGASADPSQAQSPAALRKLHELGYTSDARVAVERWRADNGRTGTGPLTSEETAALMAQPLPEFLAALVGNPFSGIGIAMKQKTRAAAEREAMRLCKEQGGGALCVRPQVVRGDQCVAIVGYQVTVNQRPVYRTSVAVSNDVARSMDAAKQACPQGAPHPELCRPLVQFCGDGRDFQVLDGGSTAERTADAAPR